MIVFKNITLRVHRQTLLEGVDLQVNQGEKVVLRGASGSGKSSLLKCLVGAMPVANGSVQIDQLMLTAGTAAAIRAQIAFIGQEPVMGAEHVRDALQLPFSYKAHRNQPPSEQQITELLERLCLTSAILDKPCSRISGGEKQRIAITRALLLGKKIFLADEITSALDPESRSAVMEELFRSGTTLLSVSHDPEWIKRCDRIIDLSNQQLIESASDPKIENQNSSPGGAV